MPLDDYIIHVFCLIDDLYHELFQSCKVRKSGYAPFLADNKKIWLHFKFNYLDYFPNLELIKYKIFNKQATNLWHIIRIIHSKLLAKIGSWNFYAIDAANIDKRWLLKNTSVPASSTIIADKGFIGNEFSLSLEQQANIKLLIPSRKNMLQQISHKFALAT